MAHIVTDKVMETTTTTSTGAISLGGAVSGYQDFDSQMANADTTAYAIKGISGASVGQWEVGLGTWNTGNTLSRTTVVRSSNSNAVVNLSAGTKLIYMTFTPTVRQPGMTFTSDVTPATSGLAALGSTSLPWSGLHLASAGQINWANGAVTLDGNTDTLSINGAGLAIPFAGTTTVPPLNLSGGGTLMTTPTAGAIELDANCFYGTTDAGNRGIIPLRHFIRSDATRTFTSNTNAQNIFTTPANGRLTLETGTYRTTGTLHFTAMSGTSGNLQVLLTGGGSATVGSALLAFWGLDGGSGTAAAVQGSWTQSMSSPASVLTAGVSTALWVSWEGMFEVTGAGTLQPQIDMVTASASVLGISSWMEVWRIGSTSVTHVGQWD